MRNTEKAHASLAKIVAQMSSDGLLPALPDDQIWLVFVEAHPSGVETFEVGKQTLSELAEAYDMGVEEVRKQIAPFPGQPVFGAYLDDEEEDDYLAFMDVPRRSMPQA